LKKTTSQHHDPSREPVAAVDSNNRLIGSVPRWQMRQERLIHRATYIMVFNSRGHILVQKRTQTKDIYPGLLEMAAGGVVAAGETYEESAARELKEETGITGVELVSHLDFYFEDSSNRVWGRLFSCKWDGRLTFQEEEVEWGKFFTLPDLAMQMSKGIFTPDSVYLYKLCSARGLFFQA